MRTWYNPLKDNKIENFCNKVFPLTPELLGGMKPADIIDF